jgi:hypothetical protein
VSEAGVGFEHVDVRFSGKSARVGLGKVLAALRPLVLSAAAAGLMPLGCGSTANLEISASSSAIAGTPLAVTVTAMVGRSRDRIFNSPIHFTSSDSAAILPADYFFTGTDAGSHTFTGVTLMTPGSQSITATDIIAPSITATVNVPVSAAITTAQFKASAPSTVTAVLKMPR